VSNFSNNLPTTGVSAIYKKHLVHEVSNNLVDSKHIADNYADAHRYQHRAEVTLVGHASLRVYDPIYLDGLPNGMSGYWTVLSIKHIFGGTPAKYMMSVVVGTDIIGDTNTDAKKMSDTRDIQSDLAGQSLTGSGTKLSQYSLSPNINSLTPASSASNSTAIVKPSLTAVPTISGITAHKDSSPNLTNVKKTVQWAAKSSGKVLK
jgi:hypothetical protein